MGLEVLELRPGLWRWTAPHPEWRPEKDRPGGWGQMVGCLYYEPPEEGGARPTVLIDPLAPPDGTPGSKAFWETLDADLARRNRPVAVLLGNHYHERHAQIMLDRYGARYGVTIVAHAAARPLVSCSIARSFHDEETLPGGVKALPIAGLDDSETALWLPAHRALVFADAVIGAGSDRVQVAPITWATGTPEGQARYRKEFRASLRRLLELPIDLLVVSHGSLPQRDGRLALAEALDSPAWGE